MSFFGPSTTTKIELVIIIFICIYLWFRYKYSYWARKGVVGPTPVFPYGNLRDVIKRKKQFFQPYCDSYIKYKHLPYVGMYTFDRPVLCVNDPEIAKLILIRDFDHFQSHGMFSGGVGDPLAGHLFNKQGSVWKSLRTKLSASFSTGKLKGMYPLVEKIASEALVYADQLHSNGETMNISEFYDKYSMEIIGSIGFGIECNGFRNPNSEFYLRGHEYFNPKSIYWTMTRAVAFFAPNLFNLLKIKRISPKILNFFFNLVEETVGYRKKHSYKRNDFLQTLIELKEGSVDGESDDSKDKIPFSMQDVAANALLYMFAGYETSATTGQFAAYELAVNPPIQDRAREEVRKVLAKYDGVCTYEAQNEMVYLNMVLDETMRKYPPMRALFRKCTKDYTLPDNLKIEKGTLIFVPIHGIQMDPDIFPDPEKFDPERFSPENKVRIHPCHWMPFGEGPRKCLGLRQGYIQSKMALVKLLHKYELTLDERTPVPIRIKASSMACAADGGVWINLKKLKS
ncbi:probable cytochrome P450 6a13 [Pectinophora gossypiella]|uniref:probable cytochrome P450 6a13 n=1 Tax=Pectinophora gossypiella TaxID=13191 RepID=UPI00214F3E36|nr:probable cytochrome P450 6a13 [Pectinophora gossypiella]